MRTIAADVGLLAHARTGGPESSGWNSHGASLLGGLQAWYSAIVGQAELANLPSRLLSDIFSDLGPQRAESHVRDEFGRPVY